MSSDKIFDAASKAMESSGVSVGSHRDTFIIGFYQASELFSPRWTEMNSEEYKKLVSSGWFYPMEDSAQKFDESGNFYVLLFPPIKSYEDLL